MGVGGDQVPQGGRELEGVGVLPDEGLPLPGGDGNTLKCVAGIQGWDSGSITICGKDLSTDPMGCKEEMAYIPDNPDLHRPSVGRGPKGRKGGRPAQPGKTPGPPYAGSCSKRPDSYASKGFLWWLCVIAPVMALLLQYLPGVPPLPRKPLRGFPGAPMPPLFRFSSKCGLPPPFGAEGGRAGKRRPERQIYLL